MADWQAFMVWLGDEIDGIAAGQRVVEAEIGRKWVRVRERQLPGFPVPRAHKVAAQVWDGLRAVPTTVPKIKRKRRK